MTSILELDEKDSQLGLVLDVIRMYRARGLSPDECKYKMRSTFPIELIDRAIEMVIKNKPVSNAISLRSNDDFFGWYEGPLDTLETHWGRLVSTLKTKQKPWSEEMINSLDRASTQVVSHLTPPQSERPVVTKGLVLGHIQSGKTANFSATIAKAVDSGYRLVVVLAGMHNNLRLQTELRLRSELVDPAEGRTCTTLTGVDENGDFKTRQHVSANSQLSKNSGFTLVVLKKNTSPLRNFSQWLAEASPDVLKNCPMLFIDDEADQASINTSKPEEDPTAINGHIRNLISKFSVATYVGYTATPFANVFIDSNVEDDIYPKDFLVALEKPSIYYGPEEIFGRTTMGFEIRNVGLPVLRTVPELEAAQIKKQAKCEESDTGIFPSMEHAIKSFIVSGGIRFSRKHWNEHITMLVHISHLTAPQKKLQEVFERELEHLASKILVNDSSINNQLYSIWRHDFAEVTKSITGKLDHDWDHVLKNIKKFSGKIRVILENSLSNKDNRLSFDRSQRDGEPLWAIIIGGNTLSRGLTLEGLTVSYFTRRSKNYDTLLQMGRWFGYHPGYSDLVRIFTTESISNHFFNLATVEFEIREEIKLMSANKEKPKHVALRVRKIPNLNVTANNKMRKVKRINSSYSGLKVQTYQIMTGDKGTITKNQISVEKLVEDCTEYGKKTDIGFSDLESSHLFLSVPSEVILQLLDSFVVPKDIAKYDATLIQKYIRDSANRGELENWSVGIMSKKSGENLLEISGLSVFPLTRRVKQYRQGCDGFCEASLLAVSTPGEELIDLYDRVGDSIKNTDDIISAKGSQKLSDTEIRFKLRPPNRGLLMVYSLESGLEKSEKEFTSELKEFKHSYSLKAQGQLFAISLVFPHSQYSHGINNFLVNEGI